MVKIFFAGEGYEEQQKTANCNVLVNYWYIKDKPYALYLKNHFGFKELFLDSGAFTAWTKGTIIDLNEYCEFVKKADCTFYSVLDVIGSDEKTFENQKKMEELGTHPVPCFHFGDDFKYLDYYVKKYDFISLGGMVGRKTKDLQPWLDKVFKLYPNHKFHGFGMTREKLIERYPWYSVDSSSWIKWGCSKKIFSYNYGDFYLGKNESIFKLLVKNNKKLRAFLEKYSLLEGIELKDYRKIILANLYGFMEFEKNIKPADITKQQTLF